MEAFVLQLVLLAVTTYGFVNGLLTVLFVGPFRRQAKQQLIDPILKALGVWKIILPALKLDPPSRSNIVSINERAS
jgi:hypothetical protein